MIYSRNTEEDVGGGAEGGGRNWMPMCLAATGVGVAALCWQVYRVKQKMSEMELMIKGDRVHMTFRDLASNGMTDMLKNTLEHTRTINYIKTYDCYLSALVQLSTLNELEDMLVKRQHIYCSHITPKDQRLQLEGDIRKKASSLSPIIPKSELDYIMAKDTNCASPILFMIYGDKKMNGGIMWTKLEQWRKNINEKVKDYQSKLRKGP